MLTLALLLVAARCPEVQYPAVTAYGDPPRLAIVPEGSPLLFESLPRTATVALLPVLNASTARDAAALGMLECAPAIDVSRGALRSPVDLFSLDEPMRQPHLAPFKGVTNEGADQEARIARIYDLSTFKKPILPVRSGPAQLVNVPGGTALSITLESDAFGTTDRVFGPVIRLHRVATSTEAPPYEPSVRPSIIFSDSTRTRLELDESTETLDIGAHLRAAHAGFGAIDRALVPAEGEPYNPGDPGTRFMLAHGLAAGLPLLSLSFSLSTTNPGCTTLCTPQNQPIPGDRAYLGRFLARSDAVVADAGTRLNAFELAVYATAFASVMLPTGRRGVFSRAEIAEDVLVIGEGVLVGLTTPLTLETRLGRARPIAFRPSSGLGLEGRDAIGAPLMAIRTTAASAASTAAITLLFVEEAGPGWVVPAIVGFGTLTTFVGYYEVEAGRAFPSDIPLAVVNGFLSGAGVVLWHRIFWRGWPGDTSRGDLPLRLRGLDLRFTNDVAIVTATGEL